MGAEGLSTLLSPGSVAIIGASADSRKLAGRPIANLRRFGFRGEVYPINPRQDEVAGWRSFAAIGDVGAPIDLTLVMTPAATALDFVRQGIAAGCRSFIVYAAGFAEYDDAGAALQRDLAALVGEAGATMLGPNCTGVINSAANLCATFSTVVDQMEMRPGGASFVGQSGAMAAYWLQMLLASGQGFGKWISTGNEADVSLADAIDHLAADDATRCICAYIEGTNDGPGLRRALRGALAAGKPVLALRSGRSAAGACAAASHTGAMVGESRAWDALFADTGVIECGSLSEMVQLTTLFQRPPSGAAERPLIMSISGGAGALTADAATAAGLPVAQLPPALGDALGEVLPRIGKLANPLDLTGELASDPTLFGRAAAAVADSDGFDSFIVFLGLMSQAKDQIPRAVSEILMATGKPTVVIWMGATAEVEAELNGHRIPYFDDIPAAVASLAAWSRWWRAASSPKPPLRALPARPAAGRLLSEAEGQKRLGALAGIRWPEAVVVTDAAALAGALLPAWPVAAKLQSPGMPHKSEHGGVALGIGGVEALAAAMARMTATAERLAIPVEGVLVQSMVEHDLELLVGLRSDPVFGPLLALGRGGTEAEYEDDLAIRLLPLSVTEIGEMLGSLRYANRFAGVRGRSAIDLAAVAEAIAELCRRFESDPDLVEIEINPLALAPPGGIVALDLLVTVR